MASLIIRRHKPELCISVGNVVAYQMMRTKGIGDGARIMKNLIKTRSLKEVSKYFATPANKNAVNLQYQVSGYHFMFGNKTPEEVLSSITEGINAGDLESLMTLYEPKACFATEPGKLATSPNHIRESLRKFIDMKGKLDLEVKRVLRASDLALVISEWTFSGTGPDGKPVNTAASSADVLRQQPDGTWLLVIDNPWGTDQQRIAI